MCLQMRNSRAPGRIGVEENRSLSLSRHIMLFFEIAFSYCRNITSCLKLPVRAPTIYYNIVVQLE